MPSPRVATYDLQPEMSAAGVTDALVAAIESDRYDFIVANFANPDMVGHTGVWDATVEACEFLDGCLGRVADAVLGRDPARRTRTAQARCSPSPPTTATPTRCATRAGDPVTAHSLNPVPFLLAGVGRRGLRAARRRARRRRADAARAARASPPADGHDAVADAGCAAILRPLNT